MNYLYIYLILGMLVTALIHFTEDARGERIKPGFIDCLILTALWPSVVWHLARRLQHFKWRGKVLWERKR